MELNTFTGISTGTFHTLTLQHACTFQDLSTLISTLGGGGGTVTSASLPLSITNGIITVDLSAYSTTAAINTLLANYTTTAGLNTLLASYVLVSTMVNYSTTTQITTLLAAKQDVLVPGSGITIVGNTISATSGGGATQGWEKRCNSHVGPLRVGV